MGELRNEFSWSHSAACEFEECRRRRYWAKYGMWGGWSRDAGSEARAAYRLNKMRNRHTLRGEAVERAVIWALRQAREGRPVTGSEAWETQARPYLRQCWDESKGQLWKADPKKYCCLHEHYYVGQVDRPDRELVIEVGTQARRCIEAFCEKRLRELAEAEGEEVPVRDGGGGEWDTFNVEGIRVFAIPDYVFRHGPEFHIHDWKSGSPREEHAAQMRLYGLWAREVHGAAADSLRLHLEYLAAGDTVTSPMQEADVAQARQAVVESAGDMADYLVGGDRERNEALPKDEWELAGDPGVCRRCRFYELCKPELESGGV